MKVNHPLNVGDVVQLDPEGCRNPMFSGCFMTVSEVKPFGAQGYVQALGDYGKPGGQAYYRAYWHEMELVGPAVWVIGEENEES